MGSINGLDFYFLSSSGKYVAAGCENRSDGGGGRAREPFVRPHHRRAQMVREHDKSSLTMMFYRIARFEVQCARDLRSLRPGAHAQRRAPSRIASRPTRELKGREPLIRICSLDSSNLK